MSSQATHSWDVRLSSSNAWAGAGAHVLPCLSLPKGNSMSQGATHSHRCAMNAASVALFRFLRQRIAASEQVDGMQRHRYRFDAGAEAVVRWSAAKLYNIEYEVSEPLPSDPTLT